MRNTAIYEFELALPGFILNSGLLTDELVDRSIAVGSGTQRFQVTDPLDERIFSGESSTDNDGSRSYNSLQSVREYANQALGALVTYDTIAADSVHARVLRGELYAIEGYSEIMLADLFCSGVPLSTLDFQQNFTLHAGSTTAQVYRDALAKFDTAIVLSVGNDTIISLARVGRGRAWLNLGEFDSAAVAVQNVPIDFHYALTGAWYGVDSINGANPRGHVLSYATVGDREGINGLPYISSRDPRSSTVVEDPGDGSSLLPQQFPVKYQSSLSGNGASSIVIADGIEARLIQAEAQLQPADAPSGPWLQTLNGLRHAVGMSDTTDPGTAVGRISLLFSERAYWLFLTGHRQGDLRRLLREYGSYPEFSDQSLVYPTGEYTARGTGVYGSDVVAPIPTTEYTNPLFHGCINRGA
jgi:hypothetical protein